MRKILMAAAVAATMTAAPGAAQVAGGLVTVQVSGNEIIKNSLNNNDVDILNNNNVDVDALNNVTVQVPIGIAANVCGQAAVALLGAVGGNPTTVDCTATTASKALSKSITQALTNQ